MTGNSMKVLMINGSPRKDGNTSIALEEMRKVFEAEGVETEIVRVGNQDVRGCIACGRCSELGKCDVDRGTGQTFLQFAF